MRYIKSDYNQYLAASSSTTLHTGAGKVRAIILTSNHATNIAQLTLYDNTAASGNILLTLNTVIGAPVIIILPQNTPLQFSTGLTAVTDAEAEAFILTEA